MNKLRLGIVAVAMLVSAAAQASSCNVKQLNDLGVTVGGVKVQVALEPGIADTVVTTTSGEAKSAVFNTATKFIEFICDAQTSYLVGASPTAATTNSWVPAGSAKVIGVNATGLRISFILRP